MENKSDSAIGIEEPIEKIKKLIGLKHSAYKDYIAARMLFLNDQLHQAAIFANTCLEKELKACLYVLGIECKIQHNSFKLLNLLREHDTKTWNKINPDFIKILTKIYESRYHEGLNPGYNFVIIKRKFLAELDYTYSILEPKVRYKIKRIEGDLPKSLYEIAILNKFPNVTFENYLFGDISKEDYLSLQDVVFEFKILFNHELIEASYFIPKNTEMNRLIYDGLVSPPENKSSFTISNHHPGIDTINVFRNGILQSMKIA